MHSSVPKRKCVFRHVNSLRDLEKVCKKQRRNPINGCRDIEFQNFWCLQPDAYIGRPALLYMRRVGGTENFNSGYLCIRCSESSDFLSENSRGIMCFKKKFRTLQYFTAAQERTKTGPNPKVLLAKVVQIYILRHFYPWFFSQILQIWPQKLKNSTINRPF